MPYPNQYQGGGFGGNSFTNAANPSPAAYPMGNQTAASRVQGSQPTAGSGSSSSYQLSSPFSLAEFRAHDNARSDALTVQANGSGGGGSAPSIPGGINVTSGSKGLNPFGGMGIPDLSYADPNTLARLDISNLIYSAAAGGYISSAEASNSNSWYNKFGNGSGGMPAANQRAGAFYNYIGSLPTMAKGSPALNQLNAASGVRGTGPSYNSILPGDYQGPFGFGKRNTGFNQYGSYKGY